MCCYYSVTITMRHLLHYIGLAPTRGEAGCPGAMCTWTWAGQGLLRVDCWAVDCTLWTFYFDLF